MKLTIKNSHLLTLAILIILDGFLIVVAVLVTRSINVRNIAIREEITKLDKRHLSAENLRANLAQVKEVGAQVVNYDKYFFSKGNELQLITDLESIAAKNKINQRIITSNLDNYQNNSINIEIGATGDYADLLRYTNDLENYKYFLIIEKMDFQPTGRSAEQNTASLRLNISLYAQPIAGKK
jgi:hypothetical protein